MSTASPYGNSSNKTLSVLRPDFFPTGKRKVSKRARS